MDEREGWKTMLMILAWVCGGRNHKGRGYKQWLVWPLEGRGKGAEDIRKKGERL